VMRDLLDGGCLVVLCFRESLGQRYLKGANHDDVVKSQNNNMVFLEGHAPSWTEK
jgi:hypothetical protein